MSSDSPPSRRDRALREFAARFGMVGGMPFGAIGYAWGGWGWVGIGMGFAFMLSVVLLAIDTYREIRDA